MKLSPKEILIPAAALLIICIVATTLLALTNSVTAQKIATMQKRKSPPAAWFCRTPRPSANSRAMKT